MTPEERYARIDERLEAIAMHLELSTAMAHDNDRRLETVLTALPKLEATVREVEESAIVRNAQVLRHETRVKEHQQWQEQMELAFARMAAQDEIHSAKMLEFDGKMTQLAAAQVLTEEKLQGLIDALRRGSNGHN
jgi:hypothetical protein